MLGFEPHVLRMAWTHGPPRRADKMTLAREARYRLLLSTCERLGVRCLLVAHHADDQAETFLLRLLRASGVSGLACMPVMSTQQGACCAEASDEQRFGWLLAAGAGWLGGTAGSAWEQPTGCCASAPTQESRLKLTSAV